MGQFGVPTKQTLILLLKPEADGVQMIVEPFHITLLGAIGGPTEREAMMYKLESCYAICTTTQCKLQYVHAV